ncbi:hypothetical protein [Vibrio algivorus]|uniref:hypothetical protein n=1 Tax=Vibrio algivorus TaxID=1667024 RepID=UPI001C9073C2|nr:hypothetical protein [Vibrio algivorus]
MAIYNRSQCLPEKKAALDIWLEHLDILSHPKGMLYLSQQLNFHIELFYLN